MSAAMIASVRSRSASARTHPQTNPLILLCARMIAKKLELGHDRVRVGDHAGCGMPKHGVRRVFCYRRLTVLDCGTQGAALPASCVKICCVNSTT